MSEFIDITTLMSKNVYYTIINGDCGKAVFELVRTIAQSLFEQRL